MKITAIVFCLALAAVFAPSAAADFTSQSVNSPVISDRELAKLIGTPFSGTLESSNRKIKVNALPQGYVAAVFCCRKGDAYKVSGSGTLVPRPGGGFALLTARHVIHDADGKLRKAYFIPSYKSSGDTTPFGIYMIKRTFYYPLKNEEWTSLDFAFATMEKPKGEGFPGTTPINFNFFQGDPYSKLVSSYGYTGGRPKKERCDQKIIGTPPDYLGIYRCRNMERGVSGGGWVHNGKLVGVNSSITRGAKDILWSPTLGNKAERIYESL